MKCGPHFAHGLCWFQPAHRASRAQELGLATEKTWVFVVGVCRKHANVRVLRLKKDRAGSRRFLKQSGVPDSKVLSTGQQAKKNKIDRAFAAQLEKGERTIMIV